MAARRTFNTEGPVDAADHYCIPPLERIDLDEVLGLIRDKKYFVVHAPRQTGKTSALLALRDLLNGGDDYRCVYANVEAGQAMRENVAEGMRTILGELALQATTVTLGDDALEELWPDRHAHCRPALAGEETRCATTPASATRGAGTAPARSPRTPSWKRRSG